MGVLRGFALFVAVIQIVGTFIAVTRLAFGQWSYYDDEYYMNEDEEQFSKITTAIFAVLYMKLMIAASILLKGILDKRPGCFLYWLIYNGILVSLGTISMFYLIGIPNQMRFDYSYIPIYLAVIVLYWMKWAIVYSHYKEVQKERKFGDLLTPYSKFIDNEKH